MASTSWSDAGRLRARTISCRCRSATLKDLRDGFTVISGVGHPASQGHRADTWLTAADQSVRKRFHNEHDLGVDQIASRNSDGGQTRRRFSYPTVRLADDSHTPPSIAAGRLFLPRIHRDDCSSGCRSESRTIERRRAALREEEIDPDSAQRSNLASAAGKEVTKEKFDQYFVVQREMEQRLERPNRGSMSCRISDAMGLQLESQPRHNAHDRPMWIDAAMELFIWPSRIRRRDHLRMVARSCGFWRGENHHELSHHGGDAGMLQKLGVIASASTSANSLAPCKVPGGH